MVEITHLPCPLPNCNSSDAFSHNTETGMFYCHSCGESSKGNGLCFDGKTIEPFRNNKQEEGLSLEPYVKEFRGISKTIIEKHGVYFTENNGQESVHFQYPKATKHRNLSIPKNQVGHFFATGKMDHFFGEDDYSGGKVITVTEGEWDRLSVIAMMGDWPTVSVPSANPSADFWQNAISYLEGFDKIVLSVDNDLAGNKLADKFYALFPSKVYRVKHPEEYKDANDFLQAGEFKRYKEAWWAAGKMKPEGFISSPEQWEKTVVEETPYEFIPTPIDALNRKIRGFTKGGITVVKALPGTGKSTIFRFFQHHLIKHSDCKIALLHMEEMKSTTARGLATYELGANVSTKLDAENSGVTEGTVVDTIKELTKDDRFITFDIDPHNPIEDTLDKIKVCREVYGVDFIFLDHLQRLAYLSGVETATSSLTSFAVKVVDMTRKDPFGVIAISHVNNDGATKYAKAVEEEAIMVMELSRDSKSEDVEERDTTYIDVTKNRPFALLGEGGCLTYDHESTMVSEKVDFLKPTNETVTVKAADSVKAETTDDSEIPF